jgi:SAM-dependent methyltransferase
VKLEIGPGKRRQKGFVTVDVVPGKHVDHVADAANKLPFKDGTAELIFASHVLEHLPWYYSERALQEWFRVLRPGGRMEVWVPNGLKICQALIDAENGKNRSGEDGWYRFNKERDPYKWINGRIFTFGDGKGKINHPNWHRALFTPKSLLALMVKVGLQQVRMLDPKKERRGVSHGWIDMGMVGIK